ncbi:Serine/threonine-protein kinase bur1 [Endocarpon pusillum Z07020]|uniref:Serine/threonine-protein kinase BUR1 n=1 Tax=Endocarpon pusillum (strain Z07020 / HMAS-L-300199) TaxID=1263415 RepID=U1G6C3_ENDPU|nr:Serine/threonine-protein kinase bur1 [Endocarpon pusillum Z07020]ERF72922.1 Serine/threonine-protein kinase bur1 [Endocarpon pusillum Z07020]
MAQAGGIPSKVPLERTDDGRLRFRGCSRIQDYDFLGKLGEGTFGEVSKARSKRTGAVVALKKILMHNEKDGFPITALREIKLLKQLDHVNILKLEEMAVERSKDPKKKPSMFMVTPYMDHDLSGLLENPSVHFTEPQIKCYMIQLLEGCKYLHENKILHRDMKAANLLINNNGILQIADFGLARPYDDEPPKEGHGGGEATRDYTCLVVTRWYRPPELLLQLRRYTTAIDMWGVGCVFGEMFKGRPILAGNSDLNQAQQIFELVGSPNDDNMPGWSELPGCEGVKEFEFRRGNLPTVFREQGSLAISLLSELLKLDWRKRVNAIDALKHPYFHSPPFPARPGDLPQFEDSHELDRRKFRGQKQALPPAPAGGSVGMGPNGQWAENGRPPPNIQRGRGHQPYQNGQGHHHRPPPPYSRPYQPGPDIDTYRRPTLHPDPSLPLPPKPPPALDQSGAFRNNNRVLVDPQYNGGYRNDTRGPGIMDQRRDRSGGGAAYGGDRRRVPEVAKVDTYIPNYSNVPERAAPRRDEPPPSRDGYPPRESLPFARDSIPPSREAYIPSREHHLLPPRDPTYPLRDDLPPPRREDDHRRDGLPYERGRYEDGRKDAGGYDRRRSRSPRGRDWDRPPMRERDSGDRYRR